MPGRLKTSISANTSGVALSAPDGLLFNVLMWLRSLLLHSSACGSPVVDLLVRPLNRAGTSFQEEHLASSSLHDRLVSLLLRLGLYEGESLHSFRRGCATQMSAAGSSSQQIAQQLLISTPAIVQRCYAAPGRHASGVKRVRFS